MTIYREQIEAHAKINLFLKVCGRRKDGYHLLSTLMQSVSICDYISVECSDTANRDRFEPGISLTTNVGYIPTDGRNTAYKAARIFVSALGKQNISVKINIQKEIPAQAGMAGGSTDAAAVLTTLDRIFPKIVARNELLSMAALIGADVPFCITGGTQLCEGTGDILTPVPPLSGLPLLLIKPKCGISTPWAFSEYDRLPCNHADFDGREEAITRFLYPEPGTTALQRMVEAAPFLYNDLERATEQKYPVLAEIRDFLTKQGAVISRMSGSGSTVYGIFEDTKTRDMALVNAAPYRSYGGFVQAAETI
jgi:4-diphosphocytidyl-2-C-methyl-D-erythritol kinase